MNDLKLTELNLYNSASDYYTCYKSIVNFSETPYLKVVIISCRSAVTMFNKKGEPIGSPLR